MTPTTPLAPTPTPTPEFGANLAPGATPPPNVGHGAAPGVPTPTTGANLAPGATRAPNFGRLRGEGGAGLVAGIALIFAFTFLGLVWLARDVDRGVSNRSAAQSIAFQAARSAAQSAAIDDLRAGIVVVDPVAAGRAAASTAGALFASYGVEGNVTSVDVVADSVSVTVTITDDGRTVTGAGTVRAERAP